MKVFNYYFLLFLSSTALAAEIPIITAEELAPFVGQPIRVDMAWKRLVRMAAIVNGRCAYRERHPKTTVNFPLIK